MKMDVSARGGVEDGEHEVLTRSTIPSPPPDGCVDDSDEWATEPVIPRDGEGKS